MKTYRELMEATSDDEKKLLDLADGDRSEVKIAKEVAKKTNIPAEHYLGWALGTGEDRFKMHTVYVKIRRWLGEKTTDFFENKGVTIEAFLYALGIRKKSKEGNVDLTTNLDKNHKRPSPKKILHPGDLTI